MPTREHLATLRPSTPVSISAGDLLALMVLADRYRAEAAPDATGEQPSDAPRRPLSATHDDFACRKGVPGRPDRLGAK